MTIIDADTGVADEAPPTSAPDDDPSTGGRTDNEFFEEHEADTADFVTFLVENEHFAFPMDLVREIIRLPRVVHVPLGPASLVGLANLRGRVLPILDLRAATGFPQREADDRTRVIVVDCGTVVGLVVDRVASVTTVELDEIDDAAAVQVTIRSELLGGVIRTGEDNRIVSILDVAKVLQSELAGVSIDENAERLTTAGWTDQSDSEHDESDDDTMELVSFVVDREEYALSVDRVQEIVQAPEAITQVPNSAAHVLGVMDLRGRLLPVVSMRRIFGLPDTPLEPNNRIVVVPLGTDGGSAIVGVVMDTVRQVLRVPRELVHPLPAFVAAPGTQTEIESVCRLEDGKRLVSVLSADRLFDEAVRADVAELTTGSERDDEEHTMATSADQATHAEHEDDQLVVFRLGSEEFGVAVDEVQEIIRVPERMSQVPKTLEFVEGLVNLRGTVLPVIDLRTRLGLPRAARDDRQRIVVLTINGVRTGFVVDQVAEVMKLSNVTLEPAPVLTEEQAELINQVVNLADRQRMLLILETSRLLAATDAAAIADAIAA